MAALQQCGDTSTATDSDINTKGDSFDKLLSEYDTHYCNVLDIYRKDTLDISSAVQDLVMQLLEIGKNMNIKEELSTHKGTEELRFNGKYKDLFMDLKLLPVGSHSEGTKTVCPDEFDFMLTFSPGKFELDKGCGPDRLKIISKEQKSWEQFVGPQDRIKSIGYHSTHHHLDNMLHLVENQMHRKQRCINISKESGMLEYSKLTDQRLDLLWYSERLSDALNITIDLMPAVRCDFESLYKYLSELTFPENYISLLQEEGCFLVPKSCSRGCRDCFQISFANCERRLMQDLDNIHKTCYRIVKSFFSIASKFPVPGEYIDITSYKLKNVLLQHVYSHQCSEPALHKCLDSVFVLLEEAYGNRTLPQFFLAEKCCIMPTGKSVFLYLLDIVIATFDNKLINTKPCKATIWLEFNRRLVLLVQRYLNSLLTTGSCTAVKIHQFVNIYQESIKLYIKEHSSNVMRVNEDYFAEFKTSRENILIPIIFSIEQKLINSFGFQIRSTFPFHKLLTYEVKNNDDSEKETLIYTRTPLSSGEQDQGWCDRLLKHKSDKTSTLLLVHISTKLFSVQCSDIVHSGDTVVIIDRKTAIELKDNVSSDIYLFKVSGPQMTT